MEILVKGNVRRTIVNSVEFVVDESWFNHIISVYGIKHLTWTDFYRMYVGQIPDRPIQFEDGDLKDSAIDFFQGCMDEDYYLGEFDAYCTNEMEDEDVGDFEVINCELLK